MTLSLDMDSSMAALLDPLTSIDTICGFMVILSRVVGLSRLDVQQSRAIGYFETVAGPALPTTMDSGKVAEAAAAVPVWLAEITPVGSESAVVTLDPMMRSVGSTMVLVHTPWMSEKAAPLIWSMHPK